MASLRRGILVAGGALQHTEPGILSQASYRLGLVACLRQDSRLAFAWAKACCMVQDARVYPTSERQIFAHAGSSMHCLSLVAG